MLFDGIWDAIVEYRAIRLGRRAIAAAGKSDFAGALEYSFKALNLMESRFGDIFQTSIYTYNIGDALLNLGRQEEAANFFVRTADICREVIRSAPVDIGQNGVEAFHLFVRVQSKFSTIEDRSDYIREIFDIRLNDIGSPDCILVDVICSYLESLIEARQYETATEFMSLVEGPILEHLGPEGDQRERLILLSELLKSKSMPN